MNRSFPQSFWSSLCTSNPDHQVISFMTVWLMVDKCHKITECCIGIVCLHSYICVFLLNSGICVAFSMAGIFQWKVPVNWIRLSVLLLSLFVCVAVLFVLSVNFIGKNECPKNAYREWHHAWVLTRMTSCALLAYLLYVDTLVCNNNYTKITAVICWYKISITFTLIHHTYLPIFT